MSLMAIDGLMYVVVLVVVVVVDVAATWLWDFEPVVVESTMGGEVYVAVTRCFVRVRLRGRGGRDERPVDEPAVALRLPPLAVALELTLGDGSEALVEEPRNVPICEL